MFRQIVKPDLNINFMGHRHLAFTISGLIILICLGSIIFKGLDLGIDFAGGFLVQVRFTQPVTPDQIRTVLVEAQLPNSSIQAFGKEGDNEFLINLQGQMVALEETGAVPDPSVAGLQTSGSSVGSGLDNQLPVNLPDRPAGSKEADSLKDSFNQKVATTLITNFGADQVEIRRVEMVGAKVGDGLRQKALSALYYSILMVLIYISGRFEHKWGTSAVMVAGLLGAVYVAQLLGASTVYLIALAVVITLILCYIFKFKFALGAILALLHDVILTVGIFSLLDKEITLSFVAALLTIAGYSLNDTIIIYDRIREHSNKSRKVDYATTINTSINETLSRTVLTSGSTLLVVLALYFLGGPVNQDFALALLIGISVGTLSSIFISSPTLLFWSKSTPVGGGTFTSNQKPYTAPVTAKV